MEVSRKGLELPTSREKSAIKASQIHEMPRVRGMRSGSGALSCVTVLKRLLVVKAGDA